ncbi:hypothetical protein ACIBCO_22460 [Streptomyces violascens]|uniref:hypothetical protein n=1 Tax=Streptomyces violascens TaxID=67381 RepID=UPI003797C99D
MHRTRNALKLMTAVAALTVCGCVSGCVSVDARTTPTRPPAAPPAAPPARQQGGGAQQTQIVQAPAREALDSVMPPDAPSPPPPPKAEQPDAPRHHHRPRAEQPRHHPAAPTKRHHRPAPAPPASGDICALGQGYGGWQPDSPEARICREAYGN